MGNWVPDSKPSWWDDIKSIVNWLPTSEPSWWSTVKNFAKTPGDFILGKIAAFVVGGMLVFARQLQQVVAAAFSPFFGIGPIIETVGTILFAPVEMLFDWLLQQYFNFVIEFVDALGPLGPLVIVVLAVVTGLAIKRLLLGLLGEIPSGETILRLLGL